MTVWPTTFRRVVGREGPADLGSEQGVTLDSGRVERRFDERSASRTHPGLQHRSRRGGGRRRSGRPSPGEPRHRHPAAGGAMDATRAAIGEDEANSWLPFTGRDDLKEAVAAFIERRGGPRYDGRREIVIIPGEGVAMLDALYCRHRPGRRGHPDRPDLRGHDQPRPPRGRRPAPRAAPRRRRLVAPRHGCPACRGDRPDSRHLRQQRVLPQRLGRLARGVGGDRWTW